MASSNLRKIAPAPPAFAKTTTTKRSKPDDDEEEDDIQPKRPRRNYNPLVGDKAVCEFCKKDPAGQAAHAVTPCNWQRAGCNLECKNCANYRFLNKDNGGANHRCIVEGGRTAERMYSDYDPIVPAVQSCEACTRKGFQNSCDVDAVLNIACTMCSTGRKLNCIADGKTMGKPPVTRLGDMKWFRHACDACIDGHLTTQTQCSWLADRSTWDHRCNRCDANNQICLHSCNKIQGPRATDPPTSWEVPQPDTVPYVACTKTSTWRTICIPCYETGARCEVSAKTPNNACERCTQLGIDCFDGTGIFVIHDLSRVGFGGFQPFQICTECQKRSGNCDHQRPCDSCVQNGRVCDPWDLKNKGTLKAALINKSETYNCCKRFEKPPGPLYYLGMGYGPSGVNDVKDGTGIAEWVGPLANVYQVHNAGVRVDETAEAAISLRNENLPAGVPPYGCQGGPLEEVTPSDLTTQNLEQMIRASWPQVTPPTQEQIRKANELKAPTGGPTSPLAAKPRKKPRINRQHFVRTDGSMRPPPPRPAAPVPTSSSAPLQIIAPQAAPRNNSTMPIVDPQSIWGPNVPAIPIDPALANYSAPPTAPAVAQDNFAFAQTLLQAQLGADTEAPSYDEDALTFYDLEPDINSGLLHGMGQILEPDHPFGRPDKKDLNPFLGVPLDDIQDWLHPQLLNRWQVANRLEGLDMRHWQTVDGAAANSNSSMLFGTADGQTVANAPSRDVLKDIPLRPITTIGDHADLDFCMEPGAHGQGYCSHDVQDMTGCQSLVHGNRLPPHFLVCDGCNDASISALLHQADPITAADIVSMRAYLCTSCAEHIGESQQNAATFRPAGAARVWGKYRNGDQPDGVVALPGGEPIEYKRNELPATGCACATKILDRRLCRFHRLFYAEQMLRQAALMQEWRLNQFGKVVCPACLLTKPAQYANLSADRGDFDLLASTAWACLSCNDWVVNQDNNIYGRPDLVPGFWRNGTVDAQEAIVSNEPEPEEADNDDDDEMLDMFPDL